MSATTPSTSRKRNLVRIGLRAADLDFARLCDVLRLRAELSFFFARLLAAMQLRLKQSAAIIQGRACLTLGGSPFGNTVRIDLIGSNPDERPLRGNRSQQR